MLIYYAKVEDTHFIIFYMYVKFFYYKVITWLVHQMIISYYEQVVNLTDILYFIWLQIKGYRGFERFLVFDGGIISWSLLISMNLYIKSFIL